MRFRAIPLRHPAVLAVMLLMCRAAFAVTPDFALLRAEENYADFANAERSGWARWKFINLAHPENSWLSIGGEERLRYEYFKNEDWSSADNDVNGYFQSRSYLHADLHSGPVRIFAQLQSSLSEGRRGGPGPIDEDRLDAQQAFVGFVTNPDGSLRGELRIGRQEFQYGSGRLVAVRAGANTRKAFDGVLARVATRSARLDFFWLDPVATRSGTFDDDRQRGRHLAGFYGTFKDVAPGLNLDAYVLSTREPNREYPGMTGVEHRWSIGVRPSGNVGNLDYNFELVAQFGRFAGEDIRAWTVASDTGWTWSDGPWTPRFGLKANVASGDSSPGDGRRGTFNALFPKASYFGEISQVGPANFMNLHPSITINPLRALSFTLDLAFFWRHRLEDGVYGANLALERDPGGSRARHVGNQFDLTTAWRISPFVTLESSVAVFTAGRFIEETGPAETVRYFNTTLTCQF